MYEIISLIFLLACFCTFEPIYAVAAGAFAIANELYYLRRENARKKV